QQNMFENPATPRDWFDGSTTRQACRSPLAAHHPRAMSPTSNHHPPVTSRHEVMPSAKGSLSRSDAFGTGK
ncbi:MAG TPA: hypothetical protein VJB38_09800, partial [Bacteroidota bacterium]|nr:hypothetical protein [Bacteroidota bacterium]